MLPKYLRKVQRIVVDIFPDENRAQYSVRYEDRTHVGDVPTGEDPWVWVGKVLAGQAVADRLKRARQRGEEGDGVPDQTT